MCVRAKAQMEIDLIRFDIQKDWLLHFFLNLIFKIRKNAAGHTGKKSCIDEILIALI